MKIQIRFRGFKGSAALRAHVLRRVEFQLSRFGHQLKSVVVRVADINGPKGGLDMQCQVTAFGPRIGTSTLAELSGNAYTAVDLAVDRLSRAIARELERNRTWKMGRSLRRAAA